MTATTEEAMPEVVLQLSATGLSTLTVGDDKPQPIDASSVHEARTAGIAFVLEQAAARDRPVRFAAHDPDGEWQLLAHPDGQITEYHPGRQAVSGRGASSSTAASSGLTTAAPAGHGDAAHSAEVRPSYDSTYVMQRIVPVTRIPKATRGWRALLGLAPSKRELEERADRAAACQTFGRPITVVVADPRGGSGKTTTSILLAGAFGNARGGGVLVLENHELRGTMHLRVDGQGKDRTIRDLLGAQQYSGTKGEFIRIGDLSAYVRHQIAGQFDVIVSETKRDRALTSQEFESVHDLGCRFYELVIVDTANDESAENWRAAVGRADALVVPIKWRNDYSLPAVEMLEELQCSGDPRLEDLVRRTVVVASHNQGDLDVRCRQHLMPYFVQRTRAVIEIAPDAHIAEGNVIRHDQLAPRTRRMSERLAAKVARSVEVGLRSEAH